MRPGRRQCTNFAGTVWLASLAIGAGVASGAVVTYTDTHNTNLSARCRGQNAEVEQAADPTGRYVYEEWIGCQGIGFAGSTDGGAHFSAPTRLRDSGPGSWDPAVAVGPNGAVYAAFMVMKGSQAVPVVLASFDHGVTFPQRRALIPRGKHDWGDRVFIAVRPPHTVYLTWDYGPSSGAVGLQCFAAGSCAIRSGDLNVVMQISTNGGKTFGPMIRLSPGYPDGGADSAPLVVDPAGRVDVVYQAYRMTDRHSLALGRGNLYFTASADGGRTWSRPTKIGGGAGSMSPSEWWINGAIGTDAAGNLYATWDTQSRRGDVGWLAYSTDHGARWSAPIRVVRTARGPNIVEVAGGPAGIAYVAWLSDQRPRGYTEYLSTFSIRPRSLMPPHRVSRGFGSSKVWPGDTFGISALAPNAVMLSWGSATPSTRGNSEIFASRVGLLGGG